MTDGGAQRTEGRQRLAVAAGAALLVAGLVLVMFVLPAEYGVDPLGTGAKVGLLELGVTGQQVAALEQAASGQASGAAPGAAGGGTAGRVPVIAVQQKPYRQETVDFTLKPRESVEYKYRLAKGQPLLFSWTATASVNYEAHAEPDGAPRGYAESYEKGQATQASGTITAPFAGIHGWFWENAGDQEVTVTLTAAGFLSISHEFRTGLPVKNKTF